MRLLYIILLFLCSYSLFSQKLGPYTISSVGKIFETETVSLYVSVGEPINTVLMEGEYGVSQGILQVIFNEAELANTSCSANTAGTLFFENCDDGTLFFFVRTEAGNIYDPYFVDGVGIEHSEGELPVNFGFVDADFDTPCSNAEKAIWITCIEEAATTSVDNNSLTPDFSFEIQPNPTNQIVEVLLEAKNKGVLDLQLFNMQGQLVLHKSNVHHQEVMDISFLSNGMYYLSIKNELQQRKTIKLVKQ